MSPYILIQSTHLPYSTSYPIDAYEAALAASNLGLKVKFVFVDKAIHQLNAHQQARSIAHKSIAKKLMALPLFDIEDLFLLHQAPQRVKHLVLQEEIKIITDAQFQNLCSQAQHVLVF